MRNFLSQQISWLPIAIPARFFHVAATCLCVLGLFTASIRAAQEGDFVFDEVFQGAVLTRYAGRGPEVIVPDLLGGQPVVSIRESAFYNSNLTRIAIPASCTSLTSVVLPSTVTGIHETAFWGCTSLAGLFFHGAPPSISTLFGFLIDSRDSVPTSTTIYHRAGIPGWGPTFANRRTAVWIPVPSYDQWLEDTRLQTRYPALSGPFDDPDSDGFSNREELFSATDPGDPDSRLIIEFVPSPGDLSEADRTPVAAGQHEIYFRSTPGKTYGLSSMRSLGGRNRPSDTDRTPGDSQPVLLQVATATHPQTRFLVQPSQVNGEAPKVAIYRVFALQEQGLARATAPSP